jgi:hypothetical protein
MACRFFCLFAVFFLIANPLWAADLKPGDCGPAADIQATLAKLNQKRLFTATVLSGPAKAFSEEFYSNPAGTIGYRLAAEKIEGQPPAKFCVVTIFIEVRRNDSTVPGIPDWAKIKSDPYKARHACDRMTKGVPCGSHDVSLENAQKKLGQNLLFQARSLVKNTDKEGYSHGALITITRNPQNGEGLYLQSFKRPGIALVTHTLKDIVLDP